MARGPEGAPFRREESPAEAEPSLIQPLDQVLGEEPRQEDVSEQTNAANERLARIAFVEAQKKRVMPGNGMIGGASHHGGHHEHPVLKGWSIFKSIFKLIFKPAVDAVKASLPKGSIELGGGAKKSGSGHGG